MKKSKSGKEKTTEETKDTEDFIRLRAENGKENFTEYHRGKKEGHRGVIKIIMRKKKTR